MKYIELSTSKKARICRALGVSRVTLWSALTFQTQSQLAEKIRRMAVQNGGRVMIKLDVTEGFMPNCEIDFVHDTSNQYNLCYEKIFTFDGCYLCSYFYGVRKG